MPDTDENQSKIAQFVAQEIEMDGKIPHATRKAVELLIQDAKRRAKVIDDQRNSLTLRLRDLGGVVRMAGDMAVMEGSNLIEEKHMHAFGYFSNNLKSPEKTFFLDSIQKYREGRLPLLAIINLLKSCR